MCRECNRQMDLWDCAAVVAAALILAGIGVWGMGC